MSQAVLADMLYYLRRTCSPPGEHELSDRALLERFSAGAEEAAFAALVQRHGPMVLSVCRRLLGNVHTAEDAFQATFLVLARRAWCIRQKESLAAWLHGVARRIASKARMQTAARQRRERRYMDMKRVEALDELTWQELRGVLDEEIGRLSQKEREAVVLCHLEGKSYDQAARTLGCPKSSLAGRLERARQMLRRRLVRRGITLSLAALTTAISAKAAGVPLPALLGLHTVKAAAALAAGKTLAGAYVSSRALELAAKAFPLVAGMKAKLVIVLLALALLGGGGSLAARLALPDNPPPSTSPARQKSTPSNSAQTKAIKQGRLRGRFTAADTGKPVAGARVRLLVQGVPGQGPIAEARSDADGDYSLQMPLGHCQLWGVSAPPGYYTQDSRTYDALLTTTADPDVVRDFVLKPGSPWHVELHGVAASAGKPPYFSALRDPGRERFASGEMMDATGDERGKAVLTIPSAGGSYRFSCGLMSHPAAYEVPVANLEIDSDFDPRHVQGAAEPLGTGKRVRLRDVAGRAAVVEGAEVMVHAGQIILRFHAQPIPTAVALRLQGRAVDEAGKPVAVAKFTAAFASGTGASMSQLQGMADAGGQLDMRDVLLPQAFFDPGRRISMVVVKPGYDGAQTQELNLLEVKKAGNGDFGTVVLRRGQTLHGKVVDENGRPLQGALVTNMTNYFLYGHLRCRTDADGRFVMPDLSFGRQKISAQHGARAGQQDFDFDGGSGECIVTVRLIPGSGTVAPRTARALPPPRDDGTWNLTPPRKEPKYQNEPRYALLVFGSRREQRVWLVLDGTTLYVDRNADGDLTGPDERFEPNNPKDDSNRFAGSGSHTHFDIFEFTVLAGAAGTSKFRLDHWIRAKDFTPKTDFDKKVHAQRLKLRSENSTLWRKEGQGQAQTPLVFMPKPADAQVCALDGPLTFVVRMPEYQVLERGEAGSDLAFQIVVPGRPYRGAERAFNNPLATSEVPPAAYLEVEIEYPAKAGKGPPVRRRYFLKERC